MLPVPDAAFESGSYFSRIPCQHDRCLRCWEISCQLHLPFSFHPLCQPRLKLNKHLLLWRPVNLKPLTCRCCPYARYKAIEAKHGILKCGKDHDLLWFRDTTCRQMEKVGENDKLPSTSLLHGLRTHKTILCPFLAGLYSIRLRHSNWLKLTAFYIDA